MIFDTLSPSNVLIQSPSKIISYYYNKPNCLVLDFGANSSTINIISNGVKLKD